MARPSPGDFVIVTGAARRIGRAISVELARAGFDLLVHYRSSLDDAESLVRQIAALGRRCDIVQADLAIEQSRKSIADASRAFGGTLRGLVNNASIYRPMDLNAFDVESWDQVLRVNLTAPVALIHQLAPQLRAVRPGRVINLCDVLAGPAAHPALGYLSYGASKAALWWMTRALARELAPEILVNGIAPGVAEFPDDMDETRRRKILSRIPLGRASGAAAVARVARFLATDADQITGQVITIDGGLSLT